ncbi:hypothetical protein [Mycobacterium sp. E342]|uniref:hypothetical protein n=1 Tax=Mycobacterium sp. E342 TaxID=1834147 RepID=UPI000B26F360|nr:hypothetical protein [Mycobacterium sp. E342]
MNRVESLRAIAAQLVAEGDRVRVIDNLDASRELVLKGGPYKRRTLAERETTTVRYFNLTIYVEDDDPVDVEEHSLFRNVVRASLHRLRNWPQPESAPQAKD